MLKKMIRAGTVLLLTLGLAACSSGTGGTTTSTPAGGTSGTGGTSTAKYTLKLGHLQTDDHPYGKGAIKFKELVEKNSNGQIKVEIFGNSQLGNARDEIEGLQLGTLQLHIGSVAPVANFAPKMGALSLPYLFTSREQAYKVLDGPVGQEVAKDLDSKGIVLLSYMENGWRHMTNNVRPIHSAADVKGLKMRALESPVYVDMFKALGAQVTTIPFGELYTAMEQKVVDGQENPLAQIAVNKFNEVQKYLTLDGHTYDPAVFLMSKNALNGLPPNLQKVVKDAAKQATDYERQVSAEDEKKFLDQLKKAGMIVDEHPDIKSFKEAVQPVYTKYKSQFGDIVKQIQNTK